MKTSIYHLHTVCCSEARALRLGCWKHGIFRITDLFQQLLLSLVAFDRRPNIESILVRNMLENILLDARYAIPIASDAHVSS